MWLLRSGRTLADRSYINFHCSGLRQQRSSPTGKLHRARFRTTHTADRLHRADAANVHQATDLQLHRHLPQPNYIKLYDYAGPLVTYFFNTALTSTLRHREGTPSSDIIVDTPLQHHCRHITAKVVINVVFITIIINTLPPPCPQDGHLTSSDRLFCKMRPRRWQ